jgi:hypothetical protein
VSFFFDVFSFLSEKVLSQNVQDVGAEHAVVRHFAVLAVRELDDRNVLKLKDHLF